MECERKESIGFGWGIRMMMTVGGQVGAGRVPRQPRKEQRFIGVKLGIENEIDSIVGRIPSWTES